MNDRLWGSMVNLHCENRELPMSQLGQKHALPHCNSNGRFTSISGHKTADSRFGKPEGYRCWIDIMSLIF